jgi:hypothetical protein
MEVGGSNLQDIIAQDELGDSSTLPGFPARFSGFPSFPCTPRHHGST